MWRARINEKPSRLTRREIDGVIFHGDLHVDHVSVDVGKNCAGLLERKIPQRCLCCTSELRQSVTGGPAVQNACAKGVIAIVKSCTDGFVMINMGDSPPFSLDS